MPSFLCCLQSVDVLIYPFDLIWNWISFGFWTVIPALFSVRTTANYNLPLLTFTITLTFMFTWLLVKPYDSFFHYWKGRDYIISSACCSEGRPHANVHWWRVCAAALHLTRCPGQVWPLHCYCSAPFSSFLTDWLTDLPTADLKTQQIDWVHDYCWSQTIVVFSGLACPLMGLKIERGWISVDSRRKVETHTLLITHQLFQPCSRRVTNSFIL